MLKHLTALYTLTTSLLFSSCDILDTNGSIFSQLPGYNSTTAALTPYGQGCTNQNFRLDTGGKSYFVRMSSQPKETLGISFQNEIAMIHLGASLNLAPPIIAADADKGIIISQFIQGTPVDLRNKEKLAETMAIIKRLHSSQAQLPFLATPETFITHYLDIIARLNLPMTPEQQQLVAARPKLFMENLTPCHLDLKGENIIDDGQRLWLVDWEYGGMSDPLMDIAQLTPSESFNEAETLLALSYYDPQATQPTKDRLEKLRILSNIRIALWCLIMANTSTLDHPYERWTNELFHDIQTATTVD